MKPQKLKIKYPRQRQMLNDLSFNLNCAVKAYRKLLQFASEIRAALLSDRTEQLLKIALKQTNLAKRLQAHEEARMTLIERFATSFALSKDRLNLTQLILLVPEPYATNYANLRNELNYLISKLDVICFQNCRLISSNIKYLDEMLSLLANLSGDSEATYINTGKINNSPCNPHFALYEF
jgi:hypothetical protein